MPENSRRAGARPRYDPSTDRLRLRRLTTDLTQTLEAFYGHEELVKGSLQTLRRCCGKRRCRCARGQLHVSSVFVDRSSARRSIRKVNRALERALKQPTRRYLALRRRRARLSKLYREILECGDRLAQYRLRAGNRLLRRLHWS